MQYQIVLTCKCGHRKTIYPSELARQAGWDARLEDIARRFKCSQCGGHEVGWAIASLPRRIRGSEATQVACPHPDI